MALLEAEIAPPIRRKSSKQKTNPDPRVPNSMPTDLGDSLLEHGAVNSLVGTLTARTLMLAELSLFLEVSGTHRASLDELSDLIIEENVCAKPSLSTRRKTFRHLRELYALDSAIPLWRVTRFLWWQSASERPLLALLLAFAREPLLRITWDAVAPHPLGQVLMPSDLEGVVEASLPDHYKPSTRRSLGKNAASAWAQSGHLTKTSPKKRARAQGGAATMALALYLAQLEGLSPARCFDSRWTALLDAPAPVLDGWAFEAHKLGWLDYRRIENVVHLDVSRLDNLAT